MRMYLIQGSHFVQLVCISVLLRFGLVHAQSCNAASTQISGGHFYKRKYMKSNVMKMFEKYGPTMCIKACSRYSGCNGINFDRNKLICELLTVKSDDQMEENQHYEYSSLSSWDKIWAGVFPGCDKCWPNPCRVNQKCVITKSNQPVCVNDVCKCESGWKYYKRNCYYFEKNDLLSFTDAQDYCKKNNSMLVKVETEEEDKWITNNLDAVKSWIGAKTNGTKFYWLDGSRVEYTHWFPGEPAGNGRCIQFWFVEQKYFWNDNYCDSPSGYICERMCRS